MSNAYGGAGVSLNYRGTNALQPPNYTFAKTDPTTTSKNASLGDLWLNTLTKQAFILVSLEGTVGSDGMVATWTEITGQDGSGPVLTISGATGTATPNSSGNISFAAVGGTTAFTGSGSTITLTMDRFGSANMGIGSNSLGVSLTSGTANVCVGSLSGFAITSGVGNTGLGYEAVEDVTTGLSNTAIGVGSYGSLITGSYNTGLGGNTGLNYTTSESSNILIGYNVRGTIGESNALRIGVATGTGNGEINKTFIQGIVGITTSNTELVTINTATSQMGTIPIPSTALSYTEITGTSVSLEAGNGYILNNAALVTATLPATAVVGDVIEVIGKGAGGWRIAQNAGQTILLGNLATTTGVGGSISNVERYNSVTLVCITADTEFVMDTYTGTINFV